MKFGGIPHPILLINVLLFEHNKKIFFQKKTKQTKKMNYYLSNGIAGAIATSIVSKSSTSPIPFAGYYPNYITGFVNGVINYIARTSLDPPVRGLILPLTYDGGLDGKITYAIQLGLGAATQANIGAIQGDSLTDSKNLTIGALIVPLSSAVQRFF